MMIKNTLLKQIGKKLILVFLISSAFCLLFQIQTALLHIFLLSLIISLVSLIAEKSILSSKEPVIRYLYALFLFVIFIVLVNLYTFVLFGRGMLEQVTAFYFAISLTIFITVYDFYKPEKK